MLEARAPMASLRHIHRYMNERRTVVLVDGRTGKISRVDTFFPKNETVVTVWLKDQVDSGLVKVGLDDVVGPVPVA
jgi:hypothetical protein